MLTTLNTAYTDTRAGDLAWCLGKDALPALAVLDLDLDLGGAGTGPVPGPDAGAGPGYGPAPGYSPAPAPGPNSVRVPGSDSGTRGTTARVQLRLLGASHQVLLESPRGQCSETVACLPGSTTPLPLGVAKRIGAWDYEFAARVETLSEDSFSRAAPKSCSRRSPTIPTGSPGRFPATHTRSPPCLPSTRKAASIGGHGTPISKKDGW